VIRFTPGSEFILIGLQKKAEEFVFFTIRDTPTFKKRALLLTKHITTTRQVQETQFLLDDNKARGGPLLEVRGFNVAFTADGINKLVASGAGMDPSFLAGAVNKAVGPDGLNDPVDANGKPKWLPAFNGGAIDGVWLVTGETKEAAQALAKRIVDNLGDSINVVHQDEGLVRPGREDGHEHFGYSDGVSQPGVRGLTPRQNPNDETQGLPGQDLLWPGQFVFGYPTQVASDDQAEGDPRPMAFPWMRNGSYMVFRRLKQLVPEFHAFSHDQGVAKGMDPTLLEARMVGRWKGGAPLELTPLQDDQTLGRDKLNNNDFVYSTDPAQRLCPYAAHIRKVYPRDDLVGTIIPGSDGKPPTTIENEGLIQIRRIMRAGIAFGPEVDSDKEKKQTVYERGLMFVCYQTSIVDQFEFVQKSWANSPGFVFGKTRPNNGQSVTPGFDPIIGQAAGNNRAREMDEPIPNFPTGNTRSDLDIPTDFVVPTGGGYFFAPSITALETTLLA
jgi:Dyp-type peroxidase family